MNLVRPRILAIDDTPANLQMLGAALATNFDLAIATSGPTGLALAADNPPDLILLDVMMPGMDGYETCRRFKEMPALRDIPIVFVTALRESEIAGLDLGAADYITKPLNVAVATRRIANLLERERLRRSLARRNAELEEVVRARTAALSIAREAAEAGNRAKGLFLANMSHELRTPLNAILGFNIVARRSATDPRQAENLEAAIGACRQLLALITKVLDTTRFEAERLRLEPEDFELGALLANVEAVVRQDATVRGLDFHCDAGPALRRRRFHGDPVRLTQILINLADNAIKFTPRGSVLLGCHVADEADGPASLHFEVIDTGIGIAAADQQRIFEPFEQVDASSTRRYGGAGLGLSISRSLARLMGGDITVSSVPGQGSSFRFKVRLRAALAETRAGTAPSAAEGRLRAGYRGARVLVIEDNVLIGEMTLALLAECSLIGETAGSRGAALATIAAGGYRAALLDVEVPGCDDDTARQLRLAAGDPGLPVIALNGAGVPMSPGFSCTDGPDAWLAKPCDAETLFATLLGCLEQHDREHDRPRDGR